MDQAVPSTSTIAPSPNRDASPAAVATTVAMESVLRAFNKRRHQRRILDAVRDAIVLLEHRGTILRIRSREPVQEAKARVDAAQALRMVLAAREGL